MRCIHLPLGEGDGSLDLPLMAYRLANWVLDDVALVIISCGETPVVKMTNLRALFARRSPASAFLYETGPTGRAGESFL